MNSNHERLARCFQNVFPEMGPEEIPRASTASVSKWDSVAHVQLLASVEEEFGLQFEMEDFEELVSFPLIADYVERHEGTRPA
jgi:acyl carrier protein